MKHQLSKSDIQSLFRDLDAELKKSEQKGELYLVGGAVMCLAFGARESTQDVDAIFEPSTVVRAAAKRVGSQRGVDPNWLNDGVKGFLSKTAEFEPVLELENLKVSTATPEYLLAMKFLAMRLGEGTKDAEDIRFLVRYLNMEDPKEVFQVVEKFYPRKLVPTKTQNFVESIFSKN